MHQNTRQYYARTGASHAAPRRGGGGYGGSGGFRSLRLLELVVLAIVFILGISVGLHLKHRQDLQQQESPSQKLFMLKQQQQQQQQACDALIAKAEDARDIFWHDKNEKEKARAATTAAAASAAEIAKGAARIKELEATVGQQLREISERMEEEEADAKKNVPAARLAADCGEEDKNAAALLRNLTEARMHTGYQSIATVTASDIWSTLLGHLPPLEDVSKMDGPALLVSNTASKQLQSLPVDLSYTDTFAQCKFLNLVMTSKDPGTCHLLLPTDRQTVPGTIYAHKKNNHLWEAQAKAPKESKLVVNPSHRRMHEFKLSKLFTHIKEIEEDLTKILGEMMTNLEEDKKGESVQDEEEEEDGDASSTTTTTNKDKDTHTHTPKPFIHVMILNSGNLEMFLNMMCSAHHKAHLDFRASLLIFTADPTITHTLTQLGYYTYTHPAFGEYSSEEHKAYGDQQFLDMMWLKTVSGWCVNRLGYDFLYLDSDLVYFKDTSSLFVDEKIDLFMQDDGARSDRFGPNYGNTGFFYVRCNERTRHLLQAMLFSYELVLAWRSHQAIFAFLLEEHYMRNLLMVKTLPLMDLPTGKIYHHRKKEMEELVDGSREMYVFHMNWALNNEDKAKYYRELGWWFVDSELCGIGSGGGGGGKEGEEEEEEEGEGKKGTLPLSIRRMEDCCVVPEPVSWPPAQTEGEKNDAEIKERIKAKKEALAAEAKANRTAAAAAAAAVAGKGGKEGVAVGENRK